VFTRVKACLLADRLYAASTSKAPTASLLPLPFRLLPAGTTSCRTGLTPAENHRLFTAHTRYRKKNTNLRTSLERIILKAQLKPWPKLFQNLRSSRETELTQKFPLHVVCAWMGNSQLVAAKHYLQVTDEHFRAATGQNDEKQNSGQHAIADAIASEEYGRNSD
jgi:hypothetical protein